MTPLQPAPVTAADAIPAPPGLRRRQQRHAPLAASFAALSARCADVGAALYADLEVTNAEEELQGAPTGASAPGVGDAQAHNFRRVTPRPSAVALVPQLRAESPFRQAGDEQAPATHTLADQRTLDLHAFVEARAAASAGWRLRPLPFLSWLVAFSFLRAAFVSAPGAFLLRSVCLPQSFGFVQALIRLSNLVYPTLGDVQLCAVMPMNIHIRPTDIRVLKPRST